MITTKIFTHFTLTCAAAFTLGAATLMTSCGKDDGGEEPTAPLNSRITWKNGGYVLTTDPKDAGLYFKFGSVVGIYSGNGAVQTLPETNIDVFDAGDIAWNPTDVTVWDAVPSYAFADYDTAPGTTVTLESGYHTVANVKAGKGDPCRLVGLDLEEIKTATAASLTTADIDNGLWRLPTNAENKSFSGQTFKAAYTAHWTTLNGVNGGMFPNATDGGEATFLPAVGYRYFGGGVVYDQGTIGYYWSSMLSGSFHYGYGLGFSNGYVSPQILNTYSLGFAVRCVRQ